MRTKLATVALAALLTVGSTAVALAQAADTITAENQNNASQTMTQNSGPDGGFSAHHHPHGTPVW
jgi:hypothetical protein